MRSEIVSQEKNITTIKVIVDGQDLKKEINKTYAKISKNTAIPGFRKGRTPKKVLDLRFGKDAIAAEALESMLPGLISDLTDDYDLDLIEEPDIRVDVLEDGKDAELTVVFEVEPEVALADLSGITVTIPKISVTDSAVDDALEDLRRQHSELNTVYRESREGDVVVADYSTVVVDEDGAEIVSHPAERHSFELNPANLKKDVYDALVGVSMGRDCDAQVTIDSDYHDPKIAGKVARYHFDIKEIKERKLPDLDDELARKIMGEDGSVSSLRERMRSTMQDQADKESRAIGENSMVAQAVEGSSMEFPPSMMEKQKNHIRENIRKGQGEALSEDEIQARAEKDIKEFFVMEAYGKDLGIALTKEDLDAEFSRVAAANGVPLDSVKRAFLKNRDNIHGLANALRMQKTIQAMMEKVQIQNEEADD